jgi:molybdopterin molybdotransferase
VIGFDEAVARVVESARTLGAERIPLHEAPGRALAAPVVADGDVPPFDTTAMDGWAVHVADAAAGSVLRVAGTLGAGVAPDRPLGAGEALKVMTGAPIPHGCEAIVPLEEAAADGNLVRIVKAPKPRAHIRARGEVIAEGATLLTPGRRLTPADLAVAAAAGRAAVAVARRARAAVLVTGDEVVAPDAAPGPAQIRNTNGPLLLGALLRSGAHVLDLGLVGDGEAPLRAALAGVFERGLDVLLTTGGVSAGDYDLMPSLLASLGAEVVFHKVSLRPAKPLLFARAGATLVFALPGNPVSAAVAFDMFVRAALRKMSGVSPAAAETVDVRLSGAVKNPGPRLALHPACFTFEGGHLRAAPLAPKGSHDLLTHARANGLLRLAPGSAFEAGTFVPAYLGGEDTTLG